MTFFLIPLDKLPDEEELKQRIRCISTTDDFGWQVCRSERVLELIKEILKEEMNEETLKKLRKEFEILINRCGCSRASLHITEKDAKEMSETFETKVRPCVPHCTPKKCFPTLYNLLYPKGGFHVVSYMVENFRKRMEKR